MILIACQLQAPSLSPVLFTAESFLTDRVDARSFFQSLSFTKNVPYNRILHILFLSYSTGNLGDYDDDSDIDTAMYLDL